MTPREELVEALTTERFTHHMRLDPAPNPNTPHPVENIDNEPVDEG